ncbi:unnamed protein product, partial [Mesorhabditis belari]|uniref:Uncharacterized protein n=1 Tax=Mesorhabditis belari TaxID=2138241 RepID=A0AAF3ERS1_9BILA
MTWSLHNLWSFRHSHGPRLLCLRRTSPRITCRLYSLEFQPFGSSIVSCFLGNHSRHLFGGNRQLLLGGSVGVSVGVTLVLGLLSECLIRNGSHSSIPIGSPHRFYYRQSCHSITHLIFGMDAECPIFWIYHPFSVNRPFLFIKDTNTFP